MLHSSPDRLNILIAAQREERGRLWAQHENRSLVQAITMQEAVFRSFFDMAGKIKKGKLTVLRREGSKWAAIMRQSANDAAGRINLLAGGPTERIEATDATAEVLDTEWLLRKAISLGRLDLLPPALRLVAEKRAAESGQVGTEP